jgi:hypothetical protein
MGLTELFDLVPARGSSVTSPWPGDQDAQSSQQADETCLEAGAGKQDREGEYYLSGTPSPAGLLLLLPPLLPSWRGRRAGTPGR